MTKGMGKAKGRVEVEGRETPDGGRQLLELRARENIIFSVKNEQNRNDEDSSLRIERFRE